ncbi:UDP-glucose dehydrogenase family protein [Mycobacterium decipiens]|uniref:UDP-glucose 6-dehydrogenase n=1 Tax=Mycobacterium decipiens TaxID=1430326 RepID=A0A1X2LXE2_9MYCO|nr:UDP-glucose/GDP-mannose dehydrogenase family protein [Mycobacterium decipiens]OSC41843.1 UDP-glucose 6-dehydrogenase [Mycobacterium decipiens]
MTGSGFGSASVRDKVVVVGADYVGLTTAACLASLGHKVDCVDIDEVTIAELTTGLVPIVEQGLPERVQQGMSLGDLRLRSDLAAAVVDAGDVVLCLPTPIGADGGADLAAVWAVVRELGSLLPGECVVVTESTVPVGTARRIAALIGRSYFAAVSNPEFLSEDSAVFDVFHPSTIVIGADDSRAAQRVLALYDGIASDVVFTDAPTAELAKYAANGFLALKLCDANAMAELAEFLDAEPVAVLDAVARDPRIGAGYLSPGPGWGGSCLPKATAALRRMARSVATASSLPDGAIETNARQPRLVVDKVREAAGDTLTGSAIGVLGLTSNAGTDDVRCSPALAVIDHLVAEGAPVRAYDPTVSTPASGWVNALTLVDSPYDACADVAVLVVLTEWPELQKLEWARAAAGVSRRTVVDSRNLLDPDVLADAGLRWIAFGRSCK